MSDPVILQTGTTLIALITGAAVTYGALKIAAALNTVKQPQPVKRLRRKLEPNESIVISTYAPNSKTAVNITVEHHSIYRGYRGGPISDIYFIIEIKIVEEYGRKYSMMVENTANKKSVIAEIMSVLQNHISNQSDIEAVEADIAFQFAHIDFENAHRVILDKWMCN